MPDSPSAPLLQTPLHELHLRLGARMVPFAGYAMPVQYPAGVIAEHRHCRSAAALFDVSHMGQLRLVGDDAAAALETLVPVDVVDLAAGRQRYAFFTNASGGILDDLMVARPTPEAKAAGFGDLFVVVNAARKDADTRHLVTHIGHRCAVVSMPERALLALQGPQAVQALARLHAGVARLSFMSGGAVRSDGRGLLRHPLGLHRRRRLRDLGARRPAPVTLAEALLAQPEVKPAGLGARDTLRLEAGLCLYGHDIDETTSPVEAGLTWAIQKVRRPGGARAGGYPGAEAIDGHLARRRTEQARRPGRPGARAGARRHAARSTPRAASSAPSPAARWRRPSTSRSRWPTCRATMPCPSTRSTPRCAASAGRCA